jgi:hypothetical protein
MCAAVEIVLDASNLRATGTTLALWRRADLRQSLLSG